MKCDLAFAAQIEMKFEPDPHQKTGLNRALVSTKFGLYDECDMGKTCVMQAWAMFMASQGCKVVAVMLPVLVPQFHETIFDTFKGADKYFTVQQFNQGPAQRDKLVAQWEATTTPDILLLSYQMFVKEWQRLKQLGYEAFLADEADTMCNPGTLAHKCMQMATAHEDTPLLNSTGTPNRKELVDCYGLIKLTNPGAYESMDQFMRLHTDLYKCPHTKQVTILGYKEVDLIHRNLYAKARRMTKANVGRSQKPRVTLLPVELSAEHYALYKKVLKERILEIDGEIIDGVSQQALRQIAMRLISTPQRYLDKGKTVKNTVMEALEAIFQCAGVGQGTKIIVFAHYNATIENLQRHFAHLNPAIMYGKNNGKTDRDNNKKKFISDPSCQVLFANVICAGVGVDGFQNICSREVFMEPQAIPRGFVQAVERVNRRGQKETCHIQILKVLKTLYPARIDLMLARNARIKYVNRDKYSFLDELYGKVNPAK